MAKIIVIGGGICGLGTALLLARDGHEVTVLERDDDAAPADPADAWDAWSRKGVAQFRQPHNFMPALRSILEAELPDVQSRLRAAGAGKFDLLNPMPPDLADGTTHAIDERLWTYTARRPVGEWVFADALRNEPRVTVHHGTRVVALVAGSPVRPGVPHVAGVRKEDGAELRADLVLDAMGRASKSVPWLETLGARRPYEEQADCGFTYYTRYFRGAEPERRGPILMPMGTISILTLPGDNGTWSITIFTASADRALKGLRQADKWNAVVGAFPLHAHWLDGEPITEVLVMGGVVDRYRRWVVDGLPIATGIVPVADAWACTNPSAGRGMTVGFIQALGLRRALREEPDDPHRLVERFDEETEREAAPWYHAQMAVDRARFAEMDALREGRPPPPPEGELGRQVLALMATMRSDPVLFRAALEYVGTITPIQAIYRRDGIAERVASAWEEMRKQGPMPPPGPDRDRLLQLVA